MKHTFLTYYHLLFHLLNPSWELYYQYNCFFLWGIAVKIIFSRSPSILTASIMLLMSYLSISLSLKEIVRFTINSINAMYFLYYCNCNYLKNNLFSLLPALLLLFYLYPFLLDLQVIHNDFLGLLVLWLLMWLRIYHFELLLLLEFSHLDWYFQFLLGMYVLYFLAKIANKTKKPVISLAANYIFFVMLTSFGRPSIMFTSLCFKALSNSKAVFLEKQSIKE